MGSGNILRLKWMFDSVIFFVVISYQANKASVVNDLAISGTMVNFMV